MAFKMRCPKCAGLDYSIERDNRTFGAVAQAFELVYHCRCGKQMFGEGLIKEYERQKKAFDTDGSPHTEATEERRVERARRTEEEQDLRDRLEFQRQYAKDQKDAKAEHDQAQRAEEDRLWRQRVQDANGEAPRPSASSPAPAAQPSAPRAEAPAPAAAESADAENACAWHSCSKVRRPNSKYCSRACSNKNARARHKTRGKGKGTGKSAVS